MDTSSDQPASVTSAPGVTAGRPPQWDVAFFKNGDEAQTALITLERNRRTFARKCWCLDAAGLRQRRGRVRAHPRRAAHAPGALRGADLPGGVERCALLPAFRDVDHDATWETWAWESAQDDDPEALRDLWVQAAKAG